MKKVLSVILCLIGLVPLSAQSQSEPAAPNVAGLNFRVVIPGSMELTENIHPTATTEQSTHSLLIKTNVAGTCLRLTNRTADPSWSVDTNSPNWIYKRQGGGYVFCTDVVGHLDLNLAHRFGNIGQRWPVTVTLGAKP